MAYVSMRRVSTLMLMFVSLMFPSVGEKTQYLQSLQRCGEWATRIHNKVQWYPEYVHDSSDLILFVPWSSCILEMDLQDTPFIDVKCWPPSAPPTRSSASWPTCPNPRLLRGVHRTHHHIISSWHMMILETDLFRSQVRQNMNLHTRKALNFEVGPKGPIQKW